MKPYLWQLNSSLLILFTLMLIINLIIKQSPVIQRKYPYIPKPAISPTDLPLEEIYKNDLFDTYVGIPGKKLVTEIPEPVQPEAVKIPPPKEATLLEPLNIKLKGILFSAQDPDKSVALIDDESNKEQSYIVGEKIKDGQVVKIAQDKVVLMRDNGQQETLLLNKDDEKIQGISKITWENAINRIDNTKYEVDPEKFKTLVTSLGQLLEELDLITSYKLGKPLGLNIGKYENKTITGNLGLKTNDIIKKVNDIDITNLKGRYEAYSSIMNSKTEDVIDILLQRNSNDLKISYKISNLPLSSDPSFNQLKAKRAGLFTLSKEQKREKKIRKFNATHHSDRESIMEDIKEKLIKNIEKRRLNTRVR